jgi:hypothetical protein
MIYGYLLPLGHQLASEEYQDPTMIKWISVRAPELPMPSAR